MAWNRLWRIFLELFKNISILTVLLFPEKDDGFNNAKVVTTLLIATKREISDPVNLDRRISFCTLKRNLKT